MSAFLVSDDHINAIVSYANFHRTRLYRPDNTTVNFSEIPDLMARVNLESVNYRYPNRPQDFIPVCPTPNQKIYSDIEIIKLIDCYQYQSCEFPEWSDHIVKRWTDEIRDTAKRRLPGYEEAPWSI